MRCYAPRPRSPALTPKDMVAESARLETPRFGHLMGSLYAAESDSAGPLALAHARQAFERCEPLFVVSTHFPQQLAYLTQTRARSAAEPRGLERPSILESRGAALGREFGGTNLNDFIRHELLQAHTWATLMPLN